MNWIEVFSYRGSKQYHADHWTSYEGEVAPIQKTVSADGVTGYSLYGDYFDTEQELLDEMKERNI